jgi:hypothetical protein
MGSRYVLLKSEAFDFGIERDFRKTLVVIRYIAGI